MARRLKSLPQRIYVKLEAERDDTTEVYLVASDNLERMEDRDVVGIYELRETRTLRVTREFQKDE